MRVNHKTLATGASVDRNQQFEVISALRTRFEQRALPMISVDTKKRELVGNLLANCGSIFVGVSHDTAAFAAHSIARWWQREGLAPYRRARQLLILADSGGSKGYRCRAWKTELQSRLCTPFGLTVTVAHYPTDASKWNPIEHRRFSEVSKNWATEPLGSYQKILNFIRGTRTQTGLAVTAYLDRTDYPTGDAPDPEQLRQLRLLPHHTLPRWNYTISPKL